MKDKKVEPKGLNIVITGNVPLASGLSSSASFVVCVGALSLFINEMHVEFT